MENFAYSSRDYRKWMLFAPEDHTGPLSLHVADIQIMTKL